MTGVYKLTTDNLENMIEPVNGHLLIEPLAHDSFMASAKQTYEEIGVVKKLPHDFPKDSDSHPKEGDKVFFDSWLAAKYPRTDGEDGDFYWLVKWEDIRAIKKISE